MKRNFRWCLCLILLISSITVASADPIGGIMGTYLGTVNAETGETNRIKEERNLALAYKCSFCNEYYEYYPKDNEITVDTFENAD